MTSPHVSIAAETLFHIGPLAVPNTLLTSWIIIAVLVVFAMVVRFTISRTNPRGLAHIAEIIVEKWLDTMDTVTGDRGQSKRFFPIITTIFMVILVSNWAGLIPGFGSVKYKVEPAHAEEIVGTHAQEATGGDHSEYHADDSHYAEKATLLRPGTSDLSFTLTLALIAVLATQVMGVRELGGWGYFSRFLNLHSPIMFFVGLLEFILEFAKVLSFGFRLFGNIFAGKVLLSVVMALMPFIIPVPFYGLEIFIGFVQALVFSMLTLVFFKMATVKAH